MADLRDLLSSLGCTGVRTHLNSGNAVFKGPGTRAAELETAIERAIESRLAMKVRVLVRTRDELRANVRDNPFPERDRDGSRLLALFLSQAPDPLLLSAHDPASLDPGGIRVGERVIYQWCPDGFLAAPPLSPYVEKHLGVQCSGRNWNTVSRLAELMDS